MLEGHCKSFKLPILYFVSKHHKSQGKTNSDLKDMHIFCHQFPHRAQVNFLYHTPKSAVQCKNQLPRYPWSCRLSSQRTMLIQRRKENTYYKASVHHPSYVNKNICFQVSHILFLSLNILKFHHGVYCHPEPQYLLQALEGGKHADIFSH